jgi:membrane fusion protein
MHLFRSEVITARRGEWLGCVVLMRPLSFTVLTVVAVACACAIITLVCVGTYTKRARIGGHLGSVQGELKIVSPQSGVVVASRVREGQAVQAGEELIVVSSDRHTSSHPAHPLAAHAMGVGEERLTLIRTEQARLQSERRHRIHLAEQQQAQLAQRVMNLQAASAQIDRALQTQAERVASMEKQYKVYKDLQARGLVSALALQQKRDEWLDQLSRLHALERDRLDAASQLASTQSDLRQLPDKTALDVAAIDRALAELAHTRLTTEAQRQVAITAPQDGIVTAIHVEPGQAVASQPLLTLLPANAALEARLYAPSRAAGFIEPGQTVRIRYAAYPYQKFGQYDGTVVSVSRTAIPLQELPGHLGHAVQPGSEPVYRIQVQLAQQTVTVYGKPQPLTAGMRLEADVVQDTRTLLEWVLEPLYSFRGRVAAWVPTPVCPRYA